jgi:hypothetical protein
MRKLLMILVGVIILYSSSIIHRERVTPVTTNFPVKRLGEEFRGEIKLNLILFFSMKNCPPCLKWAKTKSTPWFTLTAAARCASSLSSQIMPW